MNLKADQAVLDQIFPFNELNRGYPVQPDLNARTDCGHRVEMSYIGG